MRVTSILSPVFLLCATLAVFLATAASPQARSLKIIAGTSLIEDIARDLTAGESEILTIIQGSSCPGHENAKTSDFVFAAKADLLLIHTFQSRMKQITGMLEAIDNRRLRVTALGPHGSWLVPENQKEAVRRIAAALIDIAPDQAPAVEQRMRRRLERVDGAAAACGRMLAPVRGKAVLAAEMQAEFARWAGLDVLRTYGRAEDLSAGNLAGLLDNVRDKNVRGVIDNLQSGADAGLPLALELKVPHLVLSNFPGSAPDVPDYFSLLRANAEQLARL